MPPSKVRNKLTGGSYLPLLLKPRVTAAMPNPSKEIKSMPTNPPTTPPTMAAINRFGLLSKTTALKKVCMIIIIIILYKNLNY